MNCGDFRAAVVLNTFSAAFPGWGKKKTKPTTTTNKKRPTFPEQGAKSERAQHLRWALFTFAIVVIIIFEIRGERGFQLLK